MEKLIGYTQLPLLPPVGTRGGYGGKACQSAVKAICEAVVRIEGSLESAGRFMFAMVPESPDLFGGDAGVAKARSVIWQTVKDKNRIIFGFLTDNPAAIKATLPADWTGNGYRNVVFGTRVDGPEHLPSRLDALRLLPVNYRMLVVGRSVDVSILAGQLAGIHWLVMIGDRSQAPQAAALAEICASTKVPFAFFQSDDGVEPDEPGLDSARWLGHPFGPELLFDQHPIAGIVKLLGEIQALSTPQGVAQRELKAVPQLESGIKPAVSHAPAVPAEWPDPGPAPWQDSSDDSLDPEVSAPAELPESVTPATPIAVEVMNPELPDPVSDDPNRAEFERLDQLVRRKLKSFVAVGEALMEIRKRDLWRAGGHASWADYCRTVGGMTKSHANRLIGAAETVKAIEQAAPAGVTRLPAVIPSTEWQLRRLAPLKLPEQKAKAWWMGVERSGGNPSDTVLSQVAAELEEPDVPARSVKPSGENTLVGALGNLRKAISRKAPIEEIKAAFDKFDRLFKASRLAGSESGISPATDGMRAAKPA
jgi:hypothetical protein